MKPVIDPGRSTPDAGGRTGLRRAMLAVAALLAAGCAVTAAALTDSADVVVTMDGSQNRFDIQVSGAYGAAAADWEPNATNWHQGNPDAYQLALGPDDSVMSPGSELEGRIAVVNASPRLAGVLSLTILDPMPCGDEVDPTTGNRVELFDQLFFTAREGDEVLFDRVPAASLSTYVWDEPFPAGAEHVLDVTIEMSPEATNEWQLASTDVQFQFEAVTR